MILKQFFAYTLLLTLVVASGLILTRAVATGDEMSPKARLAACARMYAECKNYRDEGVVVTEYKAAIEFTERKPFRTAFERNGRYRWQFRHSTSPGGKAEHMYTVWSDDQKSFKSHWTLMGQRQSFENIGMAMAGPTGISGGSALAIVPLLEPKFPLHWRTTDISKPKQIGKEQVDGVDCVVIEGENISGQITLWLDDAHAIRKIRQVTEIDPRAVSPEVEGHSMEKFTTVTTITITPEFDEDIEDEQFAPPLHNE